MGRVGRTLLFLKSGIARLNPVIDLFALEHPAATYLMGRETDLVDPFVYGLIANIEIFANFIDGEPLVLHKKYPLRR